MNILLVISILLLFSGLTKILSDYTSYMHDNVVSLYKAKKRFYATEGLLYYAISFFKNNRQLNLPITIFSDYYFENKIYKAKITFETVDKNIIKVFTELKASDKQVLSANCRFELKDDKILVISWQVL